MSARARRRALAFGSLARNGLIGVLPVGGPDSPGDVTRCDGGGVTPAGVVGIGGGGGAGRGGAGRRAGGGTGGGGDRPETGAARGGPGGGGGAEKQGRRS